MPARDNVRLSYKLLLFAVSALIPAVLFVAAAWFDYNRVTASAREYVTTTTNALAEQTQEALQTASQVLARTLDRIDGMDWKTINSSQEAHDFLAKIDRELPLVQSIFLVDPDGYNSVSSRGFPMPRYDNRTREYYVKAKTGEDRLFVTAAFLGQMTGQPGFTVSRPRLVNGRFDGLAAVTLSPAYFQSFYEKIALSPEHASAALVRTDGKMLARYPEKQTMPGQLPESSPLLQAAKPGAPEGIFFGTSSIDGIAKLAAFRRIDAQPLIANFSLAKSFYLRQWYMHLLWMAAFALLTAAALFSTGFLMLRRGETERAHLQRLLQESERRKEAEDTVQHLQKMEALGRLSGGVAHDFNNLLAAILGALDLASRRLDSPARLARLLAIAREAAERGARLTAQMLSFARNKDITPQPLDINGIIRESDPLIQRTVETLIEVTYTLDEQLWPAIADRVQFEVALLNLAANARDAMPLGGKLLFITRNVTLDAASAPWGRAGDYVQISVTDTGEGMAKETLAKAFEPFFTTKAVGKGTGLGLSQVYGFAEQLRGTVRINSALGEGTTVAIWLPRAAAATAPRAEPATGLAAPKVALKVLLVDDDQAVRSLTNEMLMELGHQVTVAENGAAALELLSTPMEFDLLLLDFAMPMMNGAQVAAEALKLRPHVGILFVTGYADAEVLGSWTELGYHKLNKPFTSEQLDAMIRQSVSARPAQDNVVPLPRNRG